MKNENAHPPNRFVGNESSPPVHYTGIRTKPSPDEFINRISKNRFVRNMNMHSLSLNQHARPQFSPIQLYTEMSAVHYSKNPATAFHHHILMAPGGSPALHFTPHSQQNLHSFSEQQNFVDHRFLSRSFKEHEHLERDVVVWQSVTLTSLQTDEKFRFEDQWGQTPPQLSCRFSGVLVLAYPARSTLKPLPIDSFASRWLLMVKVLSLELETTVSVSQSECNDYSGKHFVLCLLHFRNERIYLKLTGLSEFFSLSRMTTIFSSVLSDSHYKQP